MNSFTIVESEEFSDEFIGYIKIYELTSVDIQNSFPNRSIVSLAVGIHLRRTWVSMIVGNSPSLCIFSEVQSKFTSIVCEYTLDFKRKHMFEWFEDTHGCQRAMWVCHDCVGESGIYIYYCNHISLCSSFHPHFYAIKSNDFSRIGCLEIIRFSEYILSVTDSSFLRIHS